MKNNNIRYLCQATKKGYASKIDVEINKILANETPTLEQIQQYRILKVEKNVSKILKKVLTPSHNS